MTAQPLKTDQPSATTPRDAHPAIDEARAAAHAAAVAAESGTSFMGGMRILPPPRRAAMYAIYAFCREVDDIADDEAPPATKVERLQAWRTEIDAVYDGRPRTLTGQALLTPIADYGMEKADFLAVIEGMEMDAGEVFDGPTLAELDRYCDRVASAVGRLSIKAFGAGEPQARDVATHLGQALQRTNILRDIVEDAERGRLYLPAELLDKHGIETRDLDAVLAHPALPKVCADLAVTAEEHYAAAEAALTKCARKPMKPAVVMMKVYRRVYEAMKRRGWARFAEPVKVSKAIKIWIAVRYGLL